MQLFSPDYFEVGISTQSSKYRPTSHSHTSRHTVQHVRPANIGADSRRPCNDTPTSTHSGMHARTSTHQLSSSYYRIHSASVNYYSSSSCLTSFNPCCTRIQHPICSQLPSVSLAVHSRSIPCNPHANANPYIGETDGYLCLPDHVRVPGWQRNPDGRR